MPMQSSLQFDPIFDVAQVADPPGLPGLILKLVELHCMQIIQQYPENKSLNLKLQTLNEIVIILFNVHTFLLSYTYSIILIAQVLNCITIKIECFKSSINSCVVLKTSIWRAEKFKSIFFFKKVKLFEKKPLFFFQFTYISLHKKFD